jgi:hypothetical protein
MDDLKIALYIIGAIVWFVFNNYKKIKAEAAKRDFSKPAPSPDIPAKEISKPTVSPRRMIADKPRPVNVPRESKPSKQIVSDVPRKHLSGEREPLIAPAKMRKQTIVREEKVTLEGGSLVPSKIVQFEDQQNTAEVENPYLAALKSGDVRHAVIYAEILKRPYN